MEKNSKNNGSGNVLEKNSGYNGIFKNKNSDGRGGDDEEDVENGESNQHDQTNEIIRLIDFEYTG